MHLYHYMISISYVFSFFYSFVLQTYQKKKKILPKITNHKNEQILKDGYSLDGCSLDGYSLDGCFLDGCSLGGCFSDGCFLVFLLALNKSKNLVVILLTLNKSKKLIAKLQWEKPDAYAFFL